MFFLFFYFGVRFGFCLFLLVLFLGCWGRGVCFFSGGCWGLLGVFYLFLSSCNYFSMLSFHFFFNFFFCVFFLWEVPLFFCFIFFLGVVFCICFFGQVLVFFFFCLFFLVFFFFFWVVLFFFFVILSGFFPKRSPLADLKRHLSRQSPLISTTPTPYSPPYFLLTPSPLDT